ncbi:hypothetical protein PVK06_010592 [Gossypium arboreum]|uniref:Aminotransferase-like plant mobile domain-containing protein n=1 Tax=Gossypium arboreum TaxID=29729 RepID=A0ABR0Q6N9_GOSAR|nr:hypothetical protein PVK06_010592 [Gossypium arboreum]
MEPGIARSYTVLIYRLMIENHSGEGFIWMPYYVLKIMAVIPSHAYVHSNLWCISAPLIHFQTVEWYHGDRVLRQFGCIQYIPTQPVRLPTKLHGMTRRGMHWADWGDVHEEYVTIWNNRFGRIPPMDRCLDLRPSTQYLQCSEPEPEPEPELYSGTSSYHPDLGADDYFPGSSAQRYYSDFDIFSPLPHLHSTPPGSYPPPYSTPPGPYPGPFSTPPGSSSSVAFETFSTPLHMDEENVDRRSRPQRGMGGCRAGGWGAGTRGGLQGSRASAAGATGHASAAGATGRASGSGSTRF